MTRLALLLVVLNLAGCAGTQPFQNLRADFGADLRLGVAPLPERLELEVRETAGVDRQDEIVRSGLPIPRALDVRDARRLALADAEGRPVPADFRVLARWDAPHDRPSAPIKWVLVTFGASVNKRERATFTLSVLAAPAPKVEGPVRLEKKDSAITVDTGAAQFSLGGSEALFDEIRLTDGPAIVRGSELSLVADGQKTRRTKRRTMYVEASSPLAAVVVVESEYEIPEIAGGRLSTKLRYEFRAGQSSAIVRQSIAWEGDRCQAEGHDVRGGWVLSCVNRAGDRQIVNGVRVDRARASFRVDVSSPKVRLIADRAQPELAAALRPGQTAHVRQRRRDSRTDDPRFESAVGTSKREGGNATLGLLAVDGENGSVVIGLDHMFRYEPQALRVLDPGQVAIDVVDDSIWLGARQGMFATFSVGVFPKALDRSALETEVFAPLNHPLRAWPSPEWWSASRTVDEVPVGPLPDSLRRYDRLVEDVLAATLTAYDDKGLNGLMTFGGYPRHWASATERDEIDCGGDMDPTPDIEWDDSYWCGAWTDYHNASWTAAARAMRTGEVGWLDDIMRPAAERMLHTQIMQCGPDDDFFYCGQAPTGYGGYRAQFNSSHAYFETLMLHYWLTGDSTIVRTLERGARSMRNFLCERRKNGEGACLATDPVTDEWAELTGRIATQWSRAFQFVGAAYDASYLEDWKRNLGRAATQYYVEAAWQDRRFGFWMPPQNTVRDRVADATNQLWMTSLYDMNNLYHLMVETDDAPLASAEGSPSVRPSQILIAWANTLNEFGAHDPGTGGAGGTWPNTIRFRWTEPRIGGLLHEVQAEVDQPEISLYDSGKSCLGATLTRAAALNGDAALADLAFQLVQIGLNGARREFGPLGKIQGIYLSRMHAAVARLARGLSPGPLPAAAQ